MNVFDQLKDAIRKAEHDGVSLRVLADEAKVGHVTLGLWLNGTIMFPRLPLMLRVAEALGNHVELTGDVAKMVGYHRKERFKLWRLQRERSNEQTRENR